MTLLQTIQRLESLALNHKQINHFYFGDIVEWLQGGKVKYVACFVEFGGSTITKDDHQTQFKFTIWFCDMLDLAANSLANEIELQSDLTSIAMDYAAMINYSGFYDDWTVNTVYPVQYRSEEFEDYVVSVSMDVIIGIDFLADRCQVPSRMKFENSKDMIVNNYIYIGQGTEGTNVTFGTLSGKAILMLFKGDKLLDPITDSNATLTTNQYRYDVSTGDFYFGNDIEENQVIQILNRNLS